MNKDIKTRNTAIEILFAVLHQKHALDDAFEKAVGIDSGNDFNRQDRAFIRNLTAVVLRKLKQIDALIKICLEKSIPRKDTKIKDVLRIGVAQLLFLDTAPHAAVDTSVRLAEELGFEKYKGLVNAILRRLQRDNEKDSLFPKIGEEENVPEWLFDIWVRDYGEEVASKIAKGCLREAPLDIAVKESPKEWVEKLDGQLLPSEAIRLGYKRRLRELKGFEEGAWWVQDVSASIPVKLISEVNGLNVLDMCAAPGGKTSQLAALGANVVALDRSEKRLERLQMNIQRLALLSNVRTIATEAASFCNEEENKNKFDAVLLDAPCSATGTIRRHPDLMYIKTEKLIAGFPNAQKKLLTASANVVKSDGEIMYCVCSMNKEEGERVISSTTDEANIKRKPFTIEELQERLNITKEFAEQIITDAGDVRLLPYFLDDLGGMDGFFISRLVKE